ncbi:MAG TPA: hypothetical protein VKM94_03780 [Blastocatellia bacterium]|nr:hypothetical protein [Blastocatellia bacterium]
MSTLLPWLALLGLGAYHGINPGMGWLFAVALGMQDKSRRAVLKAIPPIALGHLVSIAAVVTLLWLAQSSVPERPLRYGSAAVLFGFGIYRLIRWRHPTWVGMRVGFRDLTLWSVLMASSHGAGLMLVPILLRSSQAAEGSMHADHASHIAHAGQAWTEQIASLSGPISWIAAVGVHTLGYLLVATLIALVVYEKFGLAMLRRAWFNLDLLWLIALAVSGLAILLI